ncbi:hypothetical protein ACWDSJ_35710 [Nocardia sp. NPDC003482]
MLYISLESLRCHAETDEVGADEPYVLVTAVDLAAHVQIGGFPVPIPASRVHRYGPLQDMDAKETRGSAFHACWGLDGEERDLRNPDDAIFLVALMENDDGSAEALRGLIAAQTTSALYSSMGSDRGTRVKVLRDAMIAACEMPTGGTNFDDRVGDPQELRFTPADVAVAESGNVARQSLRFRGDGGDYTVTFAARNRGQAAWRFCFRCHGMFFDGYPSKGVCPAVGGHAAAGWMFYLPHDHSGSWESQDQWRFCGSCSNMFWAGDPAQQGVCPAGGGPHRATGYNFFLPHASGAPGQDGWRFCVRCRILFWQGGTQGDHRCAAGGLHAAQGFNFILDYS